MAGELIFHELKTRGFRGLGNLDLKFEAPEPGKHTAHCLVGGQTTGKTSVVAALYTLFDRKEDLVSGSTDWRNPLGLSYADYKTPSMLELVAEVAGEGVFELRVELDSSPSTGNPDWPLCKRTYFCKTPYGFVSTEDKSPPKFYYRDNKIRSHGNLQRTMLSLDALQRMVEFWVPKPSSVQWQSLTRGEGLRASAFSLQEKILTAYFGVPSRLEILKSKTSDFCVVARGNDKSSCGFNTRESNFINLVTEILGGYDPDRVKYIVVDDVVESFGPRALGILQGMFPWVSVFATQANWQEIPLLDGKLERPEAEDPMEIWRGSLRCVGSWEPISLDRVKVQNEPESDEDPEDCEQVDAADGDA